MTKSKFDTSADSFVGKEGKYGNKYSNECEKAKGIFERQCR